MLLLGISQSFQRPQGWERLACPIADAGKAKAPWCDRYGSTPIGCTYHSYYSGAGRIFGWCSFRKRRLGEAQPQARMRADVGGGSGGSPHPHTPPLTFWVWLIVLSHGV